MKAISIGTVLALSVLVSSASALEYPFQIGQKYCFYVVSDLPICGKVLDYSDEFVTTRHKGKLTIINLDMVQVIKKVD